MSIQNVGIPTTAEPTLIRFARFLAESGQLREEIDTSVDIEVRERDDGTQYVYVKEYGNDGYAVNAVYEDGHVVDYRTEGTSKVGAAVQRLADEFFGRHNYKCGFYEDENTSETTITPTGA